MRHVMCLLATTALVSIASCSSVSDDSVSLAELRIVDLTHRRSGASDCVASLSVVEEGWRWVSHRQPSGMAGRKRD